MTEERCNIGGCKLREPLETHLRRKLNLFLNQYDDGDIDEYDFSEGIRLLLKQIKEVEEGLGNG